MVKAIFNGHTWIVAIVAIFCLTGLGIYSEYLLYFLLRNVSAESIKMMEGIGMGAVPYAVVQGIDKIIKRLTVKITTKGEKND